MRKFDINKGKPQSLQITPVQKGMILSSLRNKEKALIASISWYNIREDNFNITPVEREIRKREVKQLNELQELINKIEDGE